MIVVNLLINFVKTFFFFNLKTFIKANKKHEKVCKKKTFVDKKKLIAWNVFEKENFKLFNKIKNKSVYSWASKLMQIYTQKCHKFKSVYDCNWILEKKSDVERILMILCASSI